MGMLFNTAATREMVARINAEFSAASLANWRARIGDFNGSMNLHQIAQKWSVVPSGTGPKARWKYWLVNILHTTPCDPLQPYPVIGIIQYPNSGAGSSNVGRELGKLLRQALQDQLCLEVYVVVQPDYNVRVSQAETIPVSGSTTGEYTLALTVCTIEIPANAVRIRRKAAKKKKA
jgi:hypothetical protein